MSTTEPTQESIGEKAHIQYRPAIRNTSRFCTGFPSEQNETTTLPRETVNIGRSLEKVVQESITVQQWRQLGLGMIRKHNKETK